MVATCERCGVVIKENPFNLCEECRSFVMDNKDKIKDYIKQNPGANAFWICCETGVPIKTITKMIREGALCTTDINTNIPEKGQYDLIEKKDLKKGSD